MAYKKYNTPVRIYVAACPIFSPILNENHAATLRRAAGGIHRMHDREASGRLQSS
jgi:hypothetical protein